MVECYQINHFLDFDGISKFYSQLNRLIAFVINKIFHWVSPVSTVSFPVLLVIVGKCLGLNEVSLVLFFPCHCPYLLRLPSDPDEAG
jgi:hypothetical protein